MIKHHKGQALIYVGIVLLVLVSFAALVVDGARLYFSGRETQAAADAAAIGGMLRLIDNGNADEAVAGAQQSANLNTVNAQAAAIDASNIFVGHWSCTPTGNCTPTFTAGLAPYNAVRVTPSYSINNIVPLWQSVSHPRRNATAAWLTIDTGIPGIPLVLANCFTCYSSNCPVQTQIVKFPSGGGTGTTNSAWYYPGYPCGGTCGTSDIANYVPVVAGCNTSGGNPAGGYVAPTLSIGGAVHPTNGSITNVCKDFRCLVGNRYLVGIMGSSCGVPSNNTQTISGFSTVKIVGGICANKPWGSCSGGSSNGADCYRAQDCPGGTCTFFDDPDPAIYSDAIKVEAQFIDCAKPENAPICSSQLTSDCPGCGTGFVVMVE
jgi:hypothetical protein